ncbi:MAG: hypothetical protein L6Q37_12145, partial [Bdellovibrionaceae bacterium]|nr:hypothetical protein [Pseudobdellovibrionaceae bacterium]
MNKKRYWLFFLFGINLISFKVLAFDLSEQFKNASILFAIEVGPKTSTLESKQLRAFTSDGCSLSPNSFFESQIASCCQFHDVAYWLGGTEEMKNDADQELASCIKSKVSQEYGDIPAKIVSKSYKLGVDVGGSNKMPSTYRWGYGWNYLRPYEPLKAWEIQEAERLYGKNLEILKAKIEKNQIPLFFQLLVFDGGLLPISTADRIVYFHLQEHLVKNHFVNGVSIVSLPEFNRTQYQLQLTECPKKIIYHFNEKVLASFSTVQEANILKQNLS